MLALNSFYRTRGLRQQPLNQESLVGLVWNRATVSYLERERGCGGRKVAIPRNIFVVVEGLEVLVNYGRFGGSRLSKEQDRPPELGYMFHQEFRNDVVPVRH